MFSVVKMMKEQGNQFDWSQIAIDIPSLPCFKPEAEWPENATYRDILADGCVVVSEGTIEGSTEQVDLDSRVLIMRTGESEPVVFVNGENYIVRIEGGELAFALGEDEFSSLTPYAIWNASAKDSSGVITGVAEGLLSERGTDSNGYMLDSVRFANPQNPSEPVFKLVLCQFFSHIG